MRNLLLILLLITLFIPTNSQTAKNPFAKYGYNVLMATSSKGEFEEFHDLQDVVEIGSLLFNTRTNEIVKILNKGETTIDISSATAAMSIDPLCEKYYWISPYTYCLNNPLRFIDPDGRAVWQIDQKGYLVNTITKDNDGKDLNYDRIEVINNKGKIVTQTGDFDLGTILQYTIKDSSGKKAYNLFYIKDENNASKVFNTLTSGYHDDKGDFISNTNVEWGNSSYQTEAGGNLNYVGTSHGFSTEGSANYLFDWQKRLKNTLLKYTHNHLLNSPYPSGIYEATAGNKIEDIPGDMNVAIVRTIEMRKLFSTTPKFYIYNSQTGKTVEFSSKSTTRDFGLK